MIRVIILCPLVMVRFDRGNILHIKEEINY
ncbi:hypothetical protein VPHK406_0107 [Vibrio phage K406]